MVKTYSTDALPQPLLTSNEQLPIAVALTNMLIDAVDDPAVAEQLKTLREVVWSNTPVSQEDKNIAFVKALEVLSPEQKTELFESYQRMGELYELAGLTARDNYLNAMPGTPEAIPGGVKEFIKGKSVEDARKALSTPVFETIMTMHPTNIQGIEPMKKLRAIAKLLHQEATVGQDPKRDDSEITSGHWMDRLKELVTDYQKTPILHRNAGGQEVNLTVRDETKTVLNYLGNIYEDLPEVYRKIDSPMEKTYGGDYNPEALQLQARFGSWGSAGDKDGNDNVTSEKTLEALVRHTADIVHRYNGDVQKLAGLDVWKERLADAEQALGFTPEDLKPARDGTLLAQAETLANDMDTMRSALKSSLENRDKIKAALKKLKDEDKEGTDQYKELEGRLADAQAIYDTKNNELAADRQRYVAEFNRISHELSEIREVLAPAANPKEFENDLVEAYKQSHSQEVLDLVRRVRWFDFNFSKIEYRETAGEYDKVLGVLIEGYDKKTPQQRVEQLKLLLQNPDQLDVVKARAAEHIAEGASRALVDKDDPQAIIYHTLKRMELARDHGDMIKDNVLAECGALDKDTYKDPRESILQSKPDITNAMYDKVFELVDKPEKQNQEYEDIAEKIEQPNIDQMLKYKETVKAQGTANLLEAVLLQRLVDTPDKKAMLGVVPLFEEHETMRSVDGIMESAYGNAAYRDHLNALKADRGYESITQQIQIAHSDNRRRAGSLAGTAFIHEAHDKLRALGEGLGITTQFFEGGSMSDAYRNGVRSVSAQVNAYGLQDFAKFTFQGRDLQNYFNHPGSIERFFTRQFVHSAGGKDTREDDGKTVRVTNKVMNEVAIGALKRTLSDYIKDDFSDKAIGTLLAALGKGYDREAIEANRGSRAAARGLLAFASSAVAAVQNMVGMVAEKIEKTIDTVNVKKLRTIPFSMMPQQNRFSMAWVGGQNLDKYLDEEIDHRVEVLQTKPQADRNPDEQKFMEEFGPDSTRTREEKIHILYDKSPAFRDAMDKAAFAVARTDMKAVIGDVTQKLKNSNNPDNKTLLLRAKNYAEKLAKETYHPMAQIAFAALTGKDIQSESNQNKFTRYMNPRQPDEQAAMTQALDNLNKLGQQISLKNSYQDFALYAKSKLGDEKDASENHDLAVLLAAGLTSTHSRFPMADDKAYGNSLRQSLQEQPAMAI